MFVPPSWGAVLLEGPPAACLSLRPVGGSGCIHSQGLLKWHHGFFLKSSTLPLGFAKYEKKKKGDFSCIWMSGPPARTLGQRKQTRLHPSIQTSLGVGSLGLLLALWTQTHAQKCPAGKAWPPFLSESWARGSVQLWRGSAWTLPPSPGAAGPGGVPGLRRSLKTDPALNNQLSSRTPGVWVPSVPGT